MVCSTGRTDPAAPGYAIRLARRDDPPHLPEIERRAGELFAGVESFSDEPARDVSWFHEAQRAGLLWVAAGPDDRPVAFARFERLDGDGLHLEEIDVHPDHARKGLGARLLGAAEARARELGHRALTLTTDRHVPWNAPYYERLGFREIPPEHWTPALAERVADEARRGLDPARRVVMRRPIGAAEPEGAAP